MRLLIAISGLAVAAPLVATAHHGAEFAALESYEIGHPGEGYLLSGFDFESFATGDELSTEVSLFISPLPRIGIGADIRFAETAGGGSWAYSSVTPRLTFQLSDPHRHSPVKFGLSIGYQFARDLRETRTSTTSTETATFEEVPTTRTVTTSQPTAPSSEPTKPACNPLFDLDCPQTKGQRHGAKHGGINDGDNSTSSSTTRQTVTASERRKIVTREETTTTTTTSGGHSGIHNHDANQWVGRLTSETHIGKTQIVGNLIATLPEGDRTYWGYGIGARHPISKKIALGAEFIGDFESSGEHEAIGTLLYGFQENTTLRISAGTGLTSESPSYTLRAALLWRF